MGIALALARRGLGNVWPNPAVGCILVRDGHIVGRGWTQPGGRPHAEAEALRRAGKQAAGATAYVSLEPCSHVGETPPCANALINAGVSRVVVATKDPDPRVKGEGIRTLRDSGIDVLEDVEKEKADCLNLGFITRVTRSRPTFTLKVATTLDGRIATRTGDSQWITGEIARAAAHRMRADNDGVLVGSGTVIADDPALTCRLPGIQDARTVRIVLDGRLRITANHQVAASAYATPTWLVTTKFADDTQAARLIRLGVTVIRAPTNKDDQIDLSWTVQELARRGLTRILIEGGGTIAAAFMAADFVDGIAWFRAPGLIGGDGLPAIEGFGIDSLGKVPKFEIVETTACGSDQLEIYRRRG